MTWYNHIKKHSSAKVSIDTRNYEQQLRQYFIHLSEFNKNEYSRLQGFQFNYDAIRNILMKYNYPGIQRLDSFITSKHVNGIIKVLADVWTWKNEQEKLLRQKGQVRRSTFDEDREIYNALSSLRDYADYLEMSNPSYKVNDIQSYESDINNLILRTRVNMESIASNVNSAIDRIRGWNGSVVIVEAFTPNKEDYFEPVDSASIEFGVAGGDLTPAFSYFLIDGKVILDDILEGGDTDFFTNNAIQIDYFNLIKEIKNPGSSFSGGRVMTLYTARPVKDRSLYLNSKQIPSNIFLTNSYDSAEGIAIDLSGGEKVRDIWKVRINSRYLITTLDSPMEKQYQAVGEGMIPVESMELISAGE